MKKLLHHPESVDIFGVGLLLPEKIPRRIPLPFAPESESCLVYVCPEPIGRDIFHSRRLRRLGHSQKMALVAAHRALEGIDITEAPETRAVAVGTGLGETGQTAAFLQQLMQTEEKEPAPIKFINSVHNSIAGQLAIQYRLQGENYTFSQSSISFELALWQAQVLLCGDRARLTLVCGVDEANPYLALVGARSGWWQTNETLVIPGKYRTKTLLGEGAGAILLGKSEAFADRKRIAQMALIKASPWNAASSHGFDAKRQAGFIGDSLARIDLSLGDIDIILLGANGDSDGDKNYEKVLECLVEKAKKDIPWGVYKHLCGEFHSASAIGISLAVQAIAKNVFSPEVKIIGKPPKLETILIYLLSKSGDGSLCIIKR